LAVAKYGVPAKEIVPVGVTVIVSRIAHASGWMRTGRVSPHESGEPYWA